MTRVPRSAKPALLVRILYVLFACAPVLASAQSWNSPRALELAKRAVEVRQNQLGSSGVVSYSAKAKGYLTFLAQFGDTAIIPPVVFKHTQLATDVYWRAPSYSKQIVRGMRDTLLRPADIDYYSDRFGIVQSNFPDRIRMGDGRDIADVLHPLSPAGLSEYDYAITDSIKYTLPGSAPIDVYCLMYRPRDPRQPRAVGSAYVDVRNAQIVQLDITFTRAAILDRRIERLSVSLRNALIQGGAWLPRSQQIEVIRTTTWLKMEVRGIIRGRWEVDDYDVTFAAPPALFAGAPIVFAPRDSLKAYKFEGSVLDGLPRDMVIARDEDVKRVQAQAEELVKEEFLLRTQKAALSIPKISDIARVNRAEGFALGGAAEFRLMKRFTLDGRARYGFSDREWKGEGGLKAGLGRDRFLRAFAMRDYVDARDVIEGSGARNTVASQEFGSDATDPYGVRSVGIQLGLGRIAGVRWRVDVVHEKHDALSIRSTPENGTYEPLPAAAPVHGTRVSLWAEGLAFEVFGGRLRTGGELRFTDLGGRAARLAVDLDYQRASAAGTLAIRTTGAALSNGQLPQQLFAYLGGPTTTPGYPLGQFAARHAVTERIEWRAEIPFVAIPLGRFGKAPAKATLAPYLHAVWVDDPAPVPTILLESDPSISLPIHPIRRGWYPAVGIGFSPLLGSVRFDIARGLRDGAWTISADISKQFWPIF